MLYTINVVKDSYNNTKEINNGQRKRTRARNKRT